MNYRGRIGYAWSQRLGQATSLGVSRAAPVPAVTTDLGRGFRKKVRVAVQELEGARLVDSSAVARVIEAVARPIDTIAVRMRDVDQKVPTSRRRRVRW